MKAKQRPSLVAAILMASVATLSVAAARLSTTPTKFERTYTPEGQAHLSLSNLTGSITVSVWNRPTINVRANADPSVTIRDEVRADGVSIWVKRSLLVGRAEFEVSAPADTSITVKNVIGKVEIQGLTGHVSVTSFDSDVRILQVRSPSVDVRVTSGDIFFDGELQGGGSYNLQTMKGDIDVSLPSAASFNLTARALSENINLGGFLSSLTGITRGPKGVSGTYLQGGPKVTLTTYAGRLLLHKK
jgi:putative adhesin